MALPALPVSVAPVTAATVAPVAPVATVVGEVKKVTLKKFGPAKNGDDVIATPTAAGLCLVSLSKAFYNTLKSEVATAGRVLDEVLSFCGDADKSQFPGHKDGRIAYATANTVASLGKINGLLNKVRGLGGGAAMKAKILEKDDKIAALQAQLAELLAKMDAIK